MPKKKQHHNPTKVPETYRLSADPAYVVIAEEMVGEGKGAMGDDTYECPRVHVFEFVHRVDAYRAAHKRVSR